MGHRAAASYLKTFKSQIRRRDLSSFLRWMDGRTDGRTNGRMDGCFVTDIVSDIYLIFHVVFT